MAIISSDYDLDGTVKINLMEIFSLLKQSYLRLYINVPVLFWNV